MIISYCRHSVMLDSKHTHTHTYIIYVHVLATPLEAVSEVPGPCHLAYHTCHTQGNGGKSGVGNREVHPSELIPAYPPSLIHAYILSYTHTHTHTHTHTQHCLTCLHCSSLDILMCWERSSLEAKWAAHEAWPHLPPHLISSRPDPLTTSAKCM